MAKLSHDRESLGEKKIIMSKSGEKNIEKKVGFSHIEKYHISLLLL